MTDMFSSWTALKGLEEIPSPGLLVDDTIVRANIDRMISIVGGQAHVERLRPHVKTHKMGEVIKIQVELGINKFKAATLAEAEMAAEFGAIDVLVAHQPVGPKIDRLANIRSRYTSTKFSAVVDDIAVVQSLAAHLGSAPEPFPLYIDVDCGMGRTGIPFGAPLQLLREAIESTRGVTFAGLHVYDGHLSYSSLPERKQGWQRIADLIEQHIRTFGDTKVVGGGSPTFAAWASHETWECSPGTTLLWDIGYSQAFEDLPFRIAAALITRVISKPGVNRLCLDLGHKAVAAERPLESRVFFPALPNAKAISQSEEHLLLDVSQSSEIAVGDVLLGFPFHICPTIALHAHAHLVKNSIATQKRWRVTARDR
ncbi:D-TA family PLP-dependent enzyme [Bremerella sp. P1]|uniref:D-TA family PLP-dependent enzyme n=1 Tax=Bremerella sp. P1 TaxID=3026424 RepID=UPI002368DA0E|nr:D-TA family PLP-dependent enzyme [Bremerella sp. P1]WDI43750.1 D-TA family PLP-dependent enzyme [Bremerella sp. P1]